MYKEILILPKKSRKLIETGQLAELIKKADFDSSEIMVGLDSWADSSRQKLVDYDFWIDIDALNKGRSSLSKNLASTLPFCLAVFELLLSKYALSVEEIELYFSGHGGFHIILPFSLVEPIPSTVVLAGAKRFCTDLESFVPEQTQQSASIDKNLYSPRHLIRVPGSRHQNGVRKVRVSLAELQTAPEVLEPIIRHRSDSCAPIEWEWLLRKKVNEAFSRSLIEEWRSTAVHLGSRSDDTHIQIISQFQGDACCMAWFANPLPGTQLSVFNKSKQFIISMLKRQGVPRDIAEEAACGFAERFGQIRHSPFQKTRERIEEVRSASNTIYNADSKQYDFHIPGRCSSLLTAAVGNPRAVSIYCSKCPSYSPDYVHERPCRVKLEWFLKQKLGSDALLVHIELAVNGPAASKEHLAIRTGLSPHRLRNALDRLRAKDLISEDDNGKQTSIAASRPVRKTICQKN